MPFAKLSSENLIKEHLARLNCSADFLAGLAGIPPSRLSQAFRGIKPLTNEDSVCLDHVLTELDELVEAFRPVPVALTNPQQIRALLDDIKDRRLTEAYCVRFGRNFFIGRQNGNVKSSFNSLQSTPMDHLTASKVAEALRESWPDAEVVKNPFASVDSIATDFDDIWNEPESGSKVGKHEGRNRI